MLYFFVEWWVSLENPYKLLSWWDGYINKACDDQDSLYLTPAPSYCGGLESKLPQVRNMEQYLRDNHDVILREALDLMHSGGGVPMIDIDIVQSKFIGQSGWRPLWVKFLNGYASTASRLPTLKRLADITPDLNLLHVSVMMPGTVLEPHCGPTRAVYRYHYGLQIPEGNTGLYLKGIKIKWQERRGFTWDDTLPHGAWNRTDKPRLIIFADVRRDLGWFTNMMTAVIFWVVSRSKVTLEAASNLEGYLREHLDKNKTPKNKTSSGNSSNSGNSTNKINSRNSLNSSNSRNSRNSTDSG